VRFKIDVAFIGWRREMPWASRAVLLHRWPFRGV